MNLSIPPEVMESMCGSPEIVEQVIDEVMPILRAVGRKTLDILKEVNQQPELFEQVALTSLNMFNAYREAGFSREEAMCLLTNGLSKFESSLTNSLNRST